MQSTPFSADCDKSWNRPSSPLKKTSYQHSAAHGRNQDTR